MKLREAKLRTQQNHNDDSHTQDVKLNKDDMPRKRKFNGDRDGEPLKNTRQGGKKDTLDNKTSEGAAKENRRAKKKQKPNPAATEKFQSLKENSEADLKDSKKNTKGSQLGRKPDNRSSTKGQITPSHTHKSKPSEEGNLRPGKRKMENRREQKGEKKAKRNKDSGREVVDKLDMLIEQYRSKFTQQSSNKSDGNKQGSKQLRRWFQS